MRRQKRSRLIVGSLYVFVGLATIYVSWGDGPAFNWVLWSIFTGAFFLLSFRSVEVNDRQYVSSSMMVVLTAAVYFTLEGTSPVLAVALLAAAGPFSPKDWTERRIFLPAFNFGQLVVSAAAAGLVLDVLVDVDVEAGLQSGDLVDIAIGTIAAAVVYTILNNAAVRIGLRVIYGTRQIVPWSGLGVLFVSQVSMGMLGGLLGAVLFESSSATIPLVLLVYVLGHLVFISYARLREAHESTLKGFILALEARDLYTRGHTERVAYFCRVIGEQLAFTGTQLERMRWAAIIHDMGKLAVPVEIMEKRGRLTDTEYRALRRATHRVDDLLSEVDFLRPMVIICSGSHPRLSDEDFGQVGHKHSTNPTLEQKVLAVADAFDAMTSTRGYRMAFSHTVALATLLDDPDPLFDADVVEALEAGLTKAGETYGPPEIRLDDPRREGSEAANA